MKKITLPEDFPKLSFANMKLNSSPAIFRVPMLQSDPPQWRMDVSVTGEKEKKLLEMYRTADSAKDSDPKFAVWFCSDGSPCEVDLYIETKGWVEIGSPEDVIKESTLRYLVHSVKEKICQIGCIPGIQKTEEIKELLLRNAAESHDLNFTIKDTPHLSVTIQSERIPFTVTYPANLNERSTAEQEADFLYDLYIHDEMSRIREFEAALDAGKDISDLITEYQFEDEEDYSDFLSGEKVWFREYYASYLGFREPENEAEK